MSLSLQKGLARGKSFHLSWRVVEECPELEAWWGLWLVVLWPGHAWLGLARRFPGRRPRDFAHLTWTTMNL